MALILKSSLPKLVSSQVELCQRLGISKSTLHGLQKRPGAPVPLPGGHRVAAWRLFCVQHMVNYLGKVESDPLMSIQVNCDLCEMALESEEARRLFAPEDRHLFTGGAKKPRRR